jgi:hypothetical protein
MINNVINFYEGYEGEPELQMICKRDNENIVVMRLWIGFFDSILTLIKPGKDGFWEGIPLYYHTVTGWHDVEEWECTHENKLLFFEQLNAVDSNDLNESTKLVLIELRNMVSMCIKLDYKLYLAYT